jgi:hypothetical protein
MRYTYPSGRRLNRSGEAKGFSRARSHQSRVCPFSARCASVITTISIFARRRQTSSFPKLLGGSVVLINRFLNGVRVDPTGALSIQLVDDVLDRVGQPSLMVGRREGEAQPAAGMKIRSRRHPPLSPLGGLVYPAPGQDPADFESRVNEVHLGDPPCGHVDQVDRHEYSGSTHAESTRLTNAVGR